MKSSVSNNNRRILKNSLMLYVRMFLTMAVTLFTSREILRILGVEDMGIYNVVGGVVAMISILRNVMAGATSRYLNFALGKEDPELTKKSFNVNFTIYVAIAVIFVIVAETLGLWFLNTKLVIPEERMTASNWVYQFTILSTINHIISTPYNAAIIAREKMSVFAYISIYEVVVKLLIVYFLIISPIDRLISYGFLLMVVDLSITEIYRVYCRKHFYECHIKRYNDKVFYKEILSYSSWNLFGQIAKIIKGQGLNILLNMFFNPAINASRALSYQINNAVNQFVNSFYTAAKPQITKYYAKGDMNNMFLLIFRSSKMALFLFCLFAVPLVVEAPFIINLWLGQLPDYVIPFVRLILLISLLDCLQLPLKTTAQATGKIAKYEMVIGTIAIFNIPISYTLLKLGMTPDTVYIVSFVLSFIALNARLLLLKEMVEFPILPFLFKVVIKGGLAVGVASVTPVVFHVFLDESVVVFIIEITVYMIVLACSIYYIGLENIERQFVLNLANEKFFYKFKKK